MPFDAGNDIGECAASVHARNLLAELESCRAPNPCLLQGSSAVANLPAIPARHPDLEWAASGAMALTGRADGPPLLAPFPLASAARGAIAALAAIARDAGLNGAKISRLDAGALLAERAALAGFFRRGATSPGGSCHLLRCRDGWIAVNLARDDDLSLLPAWLGGTTADDPLVFIAARVRERAAEGLVAAGRELGLAVAVAARPPARPPSWCRVAAKGTPAQARPGSAPLVVDLSSLWAGPLATHLLELAGARVIKLESTERPDGARRGSQSFYDLLNARKRSVALDFRTSDGRRILHELIERADIVVEASRPRALAQLGVDADTVVGRRPGKVWLSITGYGRRGEAAKWVAFGDDAGAAAGLVIDEANVAGPVELDQGVHGGAESEQPTLSAPVFCADAIADPLTGMHAALAALAAWATGGGVLLDVSLHDVTARLIARTADARRCHARAPRAEVRQSSAVAGEAAWDVVANGDVQSVARPRARATTAHASALGAETAAVVAELTTRC